MFIKFHSTLQAKQFVEDFIKKRTPIRIVVVAPAYVMSKRFVQELDMGIYCNTQCAAVPITGGPLALKHDIGIIIEPTMVPPEILAKLEVVK